jgi:hypothetical protein
LSFVVVLATVVEGRAFSCQSRALTPHIQTRCIPAVYNTASKQVRSYAVDAKAAPTEVSSILEQRIRGVQEEAGLAETGRVLSVGYVEDATTHWHHHAIGKGTQMLTSGV